MSTVAEIIEAVKELPETEKGVRFRELDPLREPEASRGSLARKNGRWVLRGEWSGATSPAAPRQAPDLEPVETAGSPKGGRGSGQSGECDW